MLYSQKKKGGKVKRINFNKVEFLIILFIAIALPLIVNAFEWKQVNQVTIAWDPVETLGDGSALPPGSTIKYQVYTKDAAGIIAPKIEVDATQALLTFTTEGNYIVGVSTVRYVDGAKVSESIINWSDTNGVMTPNPFGISSYQSPAMASGLRPQ
jgi:hypothetical protein